MTDSKPNKDRDEKEQEEGYERTWYQVLLFVGGIAFFVLVVGWGLNRYIDPQTSTQKKDLVQALGLITAGVAGAVGIFFTWRGQRLAREAQAHNQRNTLAQLRNAEEQLRLAAEGQVTERFTKAIDQLGEEDHKGGPRLEIRIGAIYALERIATESPERNYSTVMDVLTSYVRENTKWDFEKAVGPTLQWHELERFVKGKFYRYSARGDVQAALDVLGRRQDERIPDEYRVSLDLRRADLSGATLTGANLSGAHLSRANLSRATLYGANLSGTDFSGADLSGATLSGADFSGAILDGAYLQGAYLTAVMLNGLELERARRLKGVAEELDRNRHFIPEANLEAAQDLDTKQIEWAIGDRGVKLPKYIARPEAWRNTGTRPANLPAQPSHSVPKAEWEEWEKELEEWERERTQYIEGFKAQVRDLAERMKKEYGQDDHEDVLSPKSPANGGAHALLHARWWDRLVEWWFAK